MCHWSQTIFLKVSAYFNLECGVSKGSVSSGRPAERMGVTAYGRMGVRLMGPMRLLGRRRSRRGAVTLI